MRKRIVSFLIVCICVISMSSITVSADEASFCQAISGFMDGNVDEEGLYKWSFIICTLKAGGYSDAAIAGFMGCWKCESGRSIYAVEGCGRTEWICTSGGDTSKKYGYEDFVPGHSYQYGPNSTSWDNNVDASGNHLPAFPREGYWTAGNGIGIAQWTADREDRLTTFSNSEIPANRVVTVSRWERSYPKGNGRRWVWKTDKIPDFVGQLQFNVWEMNKYYASTRNAMKAFTGSAESTAKEACWTFFHGYEHGGVAESDSSVVLRKKYAALAVGAISKCDGVYGTPPVGSDGTVPSLPGVTGGSTNTTQGVNQEFGAYMVANGYWSESQLASYCKLTETNLEETLLQAATKSNLGQKDLEGLTDWERNHASNLRENGYIATLRWLVSFVGILMTLWGLFVYLAFWFDHINSFFYLDVLHLLTFGALHICPPGEKPTFSLGKKVKTRTVSHQQILGICLTAILFGALLISGVFYQFVSQLVNFVLGWLNR